MPLADRSVCFVGYSINDPVLRYMMDALAADRLLGESPPEMFAFGSDSKGKDAEAENEWKPSMNTETSAMRASQAELLSRLIAGLCSRTLNQFAEESRLDGESLRDAVERYEVDYAWQVLSSARMRDDTVAWVAGRLKQPVSEPLKTWIADVLSAAAAAQPSELLMSFDNDVPEQLAALLCAGFHPESDLAAAALS